MAGGQDDANDLDFNSQTLSDLFHFRDFPSTRFRSRTRLASNISVPGNVATVSPKRVEARAGIC
jgi:hypothetical protein